MKLLTYTRYLWRKIKLYDKIAFKTNPYTNNPFLQNHPTSTTIIWVDKDKNENFYNQ